MTWKILIFLVAGQSGFASPSASASGAVDLPNPCGDSGQFCSAPQAQIMSKFEKAQGPSDAGLDQQVYIGDCFHKSENYDGNHAHHGVAYFAAALKGGDDNGVSSFAPHFSARFSFFSKTNPFSDWTPEVAKQQFPHHSDLSRRLERFSNYAYIQFDDETPPIWRYWLRQDPLTGDLYLLSYWSANHFLVCEMQR